MKRTVITLVVFLFMMLILHTHSTPRRLGYPIVSLRISHLPDIEILSSGHLSPLPANLQYPDLGLTAWLGGGAYCRVRVLDAAILMSGVISLLNEDTLKTHNYTRDSYDRFNPGEGVVFEVVDIGVVEMWDKRTDSCKNSALFVSREGIRDMSGRYLVIRAASPAADTKAVLMYLRGT